MQRMVDSIPMACPYKLNGCTATPSRADLNKHKATCSFSPEQLEMEKKNWVLN